MTYRAKLVIVWRNPKAMQHRKRWEQIGKGSGATHYLVQECVSTLLGPFWTTTSSLEVVSGGRAA
jgi:hypothetical protein